MFVMVRLVKEGWEKWEECRKRGCIILNKDANDLVVVLKTINCQGKMGRRRSVSDEWHCFSFYTQNRHVTVTWFKISRRSSFRIQFFLGFIGDALTKWAHTRSIFSLGLCFSCRPRSQRRAPMFVTGRKIGFVISQEQRKF